MMRWCLSHSEQELLSRGIPEDSLATREGRGPEQLFFSSEQLRLSVILSPISVAIATQTSYGRLPINMAKGEFHLLWPSAPPSWRAWDERWRAFRPLSLPRVAPGHRMCSCVRRMMEEGVCVGGVLRPLRHRVREGGDGGGSLLAHGTFLSAVLGHSSVPLFENYILQDPKAFFVLAGIVFDHTFNDSKQPVPLKVRAIRSQNGLTMPPRLARGPIRESRHLGCPLSPCVCFATWLPFFRRR